MKAKTKNNKVKPKRKKDGFKLTRKYLERLRKIIEEKNDEKAKTLLAELHAADIAEIYDELNIEEAKYLYLLLDGEKAADVLAELEEDDRERFMQVLPSQVIARQFIDYMDSDDAADVLADLPAEKQEQVLRMIEDVEQAGDIIDLLNYDEDSAGGLMAKEFVSINKNWEVQKSIEVVRLRAQEIDEVFYVYVVDDDQVLQGIVSLKNLLLAEAQTSIEQIYEPEIIYVRTHTHSEEVANIMGKYDLVVLPVVDSIGRLLGRITIDDVLDVIREEADRDYQMASGISADVEPSDRVWQLTRARLPWLLIGLVGGVFGAQVISLYETDLQTHAAMAFFIPLIAAMGGNVGVQSSAIVVQGLANKNLGIDSTIKKIAKEFSVAGINALVCSVLIFVYNYLFLDSFALTVTVSIALFVVILFASVFGTFVPLALNRFKIDPALATGPFITTANDIMGLFIYLLLGRAIFQVL